MSEKYNSKTTVEVLTLKISFHTAAYNSNGALQENSANHNIQQQFHP